MPTRLSAHEPLLLNTIGHAAGIILFAVFLYLLYRDPVGSRLRAGRLSVVAAALALVWNITSLLVIGLVNADSSSADIVVAISTSALSFLPAILLHLSLGPRFAAIRIAGYVLSVVAVGIHWSEFLLNTPEFHWHALQFTTVSFGALTLLAAVSLLWTPAKGGNLRPPLLAVMALFLFALSFVHFGAGQTPMPWPLELLVHHAGIPLALFVMLQDFRFVLLDAFLRVLVSFALAGLTVVGIFSIVDYAGLSPVGNQSPFTQAILLVGASLCLVGSAVFGSRLQRLLTRILFRRSDTGQALLSLRTHEHMPGEQHYLEWAMPRVAQLMDASLIAVTEADDALVARQGIFFPSLAAESGDGRESLERQGVEVVVPLRFSQTDIRYFYLGRRPGGRPYLSEDLDALARFSEQIVEHVTHFRELEMQRLVSQAEFRALQSQIHPHFLFNALNTLYGVIPKDAAGARGILLNLSDILRYFLQNENTYIPIEEELRIIKAYLEIEQLRLGSRLKTEFRVDADALQVKIPILSIQPLVENAVKHGVAPRAAGGTVRLEVSAAGGVLTIRVQDTGDAHSASAPPLQTSGFGVGLENVTRRLKLCYGEKAGLKMTHESTGTVVELWAPVATSPPGLGAGVTAGESG